MEEHLEKALAGPEVKACLFLPDDPHEKVSTDVRYPEQTVYPAWGSSLAAVFIRPVRGILFFKGRNQVNGSRNGFEPADRP